MIESYKFWQHLSRKEICVPGPGNQIALFQYVKPLRLERMLCQFPFWRKPRHRALTIEKHSTIEAPGSPSFPSPTLSMAPSMTD